MNTMYDFSAPTITGAERALADFRGQVALVVNVASRCGFTPQYSGLEELYRSYRNEGFVVLGFPCNQFGRQEPGDEAAIAQFCETQYAISFPLFAKIDVNGAHAHPLYRWLKARKPGLLGTRAIKWNFTKFLVGRDGLPPAAAALRARPHARIAAPRHRARLRRARPDALAAPLPDPLTWTWRARAARPAIMTAARRLRPAFAQDAP
ncbi:glutathione peroxidase [Bordetella pertussis]|nr:glutathione peroxidase [Bordetella pertussis]